MLIFYDKAFDNGVDIRIYEIFVADRVAEVGSLSAREKMAIKLSSKASLLFS